MLNPGSYINTSLFLPLSQRTLTINGQDEDEDTPMMLQHRAIKQKYPDAILLFRVGDFYETFGQDAVSLLTGVGHHPYQTK